MPPNGEVTFISSILQKLQDAKELCDHGVQALYLVDKSFFDESRRNLDFAIHDGRRMLLKHADFQALDKLLKKLDSLSRKGGMPPSLEKLSAECRACNDALKKIFGDGMSDVPLRIEDMYPAADSCRRTSKLIAKIIRDAFGKGESD